MRGNLQKIMIGVVAVIVLAFVFFSGDSLVKLVDTIKQGTPVFIALAITAQIGKYLAQGRGFQACFNTVMPLEIDFIFGDAHGFAGLLLRGIVIQLGEKCQCIFG